MNSEAVPAVFATLMVFALAAFFFVAGLILRDWLDFALASGFFFLASAVAAYLRKTSR